VGAWKVAVAVEGFGRKGRIPHVNNDNVTVLLDDLCVSTFHSAWNTPILKLKRPSCCARWVFGSGGGRLSYIYPVVQHWPQHNPSFPQLARFARFEADE
jgi:hypothetical protein